MAVLTQYRLGKKRAVRDPRTRQVEQYLRPLPTPPEDWDITKVVQKPWGMLANDSHGDCTCAGACHMNQVFEGQLNNQIEYTDAQCLHFYGRVNGGHDDGAVELFVLKEWRKRGITGDHDKLYAFMSVNRANHLTVKQANYLFDGLYLGVSLPLTAQDQSVWDVTGDWQQDPYAQPGSWGGHAIDSVAYDKDTVKFVSWGKVMEMTWKFWDVYVDEAYALMPKNWQDKGNAQLIHDGLKVSDLDADLRAVAGN